MALGGPVVKQHYVEFIRGTGVKLDGVVDGTSTNGPWTWVVPKDVSQIFVTGVGAGGGGGSSSAASPSAKGGGGGASGFGVTFMPCAVASGKSLTVTVGAKGAAGAAGGASTITNLVYSPFDNTTTLDLRGGDAGGAGSSTGGNGPTAPYRISNGAISPTNAAAPTVGGVGTLTNSYSPTQGRMTAGGGSAAGAASTSGSTNGADGGGLASPHWMYSAMASLHSGGTGNNTGTVSRSGGGSGGPSIMGYGGTGGDGGSNGANATGYGAGGGGAGGNGATGGSGSDGYVGIFYWSAD